MFIEEPSLVPWCSRIYLPLMRVSFCFSFSRFLFVGLSFYIISFCVPFPIFAFLIPVLLPPFRRVHQWSFSIVLRVLPSVSVWICISSYLFDDRKWCFSSDLLFDSIFISLCLVVVRLIHIGPTLFLLLLGHLGHIVHLGLSFCFGI